jgi:hypothetical protein
MIGKTMKLRDLFRAEPFKTSGGLLRPCELDPSHSASEKFVHITFEKTTIGDAEIGGSTAKVPVKARVELNVCQECFNQFTYDMLKVAKEIQLS